MMRPRLSVALLSLSAATLVSIAVHEDYRDTAYLPTPQDVPTIGFGTTAGVHLGDAITPPRALVRLAADADAAAMAVRRCAPVPMHQHEFDAYVSLTYNIGETAFCRSTLVKRLLAGDYAGACTEIKRWTKQAGVVLRGLVRRREAEYQQCVGAAA
jgi:lysozyme